MIKSAKMILMEYGLSMVEITAYGFIEGVNDNNRWGM